MYKFLIPPEENIHSIYFNSSNHLIDIQLLNKHINDEI